MENKEIRTIEENSVEAVEIVDETENSGKGISGGIILGALALIGAGVAAWAYKTKDKREQKKIEQLKKKGYVIYKADADDCDRDEEAVDAVE